MADWLTQLYADVVTNIVAAWTDVDAAHIFRDTQVARRSWKSLVGDGTISQVWCVVALGQAVPDTQYSSIIEHAWQVPVTVSYIVAASGDDITAAIHAKLMALEVHIWAAGGLGSLYTVVPESGEHFDLSWKSEINSALFDQGLDYMAGSYMFSVVAGYLP